MARTKIKVKHIVILALLLLSAGLAFDSMSTYINPYLSVRQVAAGGDQYVGKLVQVMGIVSQGSISRGEDGAVEFYLTDGSDSIHVLYKGALPGNFDQGKEVVVVGTVMNDSVDASRILVKCPSKYSAEGGNPLGDHVFIAALLIAAATVVYFIYTTAWRRG